MRRAAIMTTLALYAVGCGPAGTDRIARPGPPECPEGTPPLTAREVIGPVPRRFEVLPPERKKPIEEFVAPMRKAMGPAYRSHDARVIYRRQELEGTVVVVINTNEGRPEDFVVGAKEAEEQDGVKGERLDIDGREGRLQHAVDGSYVASAPTGRCSVVILISLQKPKLVEAAALIGARG
jgi:hypothetical protein